MKKNWDESLVEEYLKIFISARPRGINHIYKNLEQNFKYKPSQWKTEVLEILEDLTGIGEIQKSDPRFFHTCWFSKEIKAYNIKQIINPGNGINYKLVLSEVATAC
jgi:hypothetical protein